MVGRSLEPLNHKTASDAFLQAMGANRDFVRAPYGELLTCLAIVVSLREVMQCGSRGAICVQEIG